jgi:hypothetical protein
MTGLSASREALLVDTQMLRFRQWYCMRFFPVLIAAALLAGCSESPPAKKKVAEPPPMPITGRQGFQYMYGSARLWAPDAEPLTVRSVHFSDSKPVPGKAEAWEVIFVSEAMTRARTYTWSTEETEGFHKGVFPGQQQSWRPDTQKPFSPAEIKVDTTEALETAIKASADFLKKPGAKPPVNFLLERAVRFPDPVWRVMWGNTVSSAEYLVTVDATTGELLAKN